MDIVKTKRLEKLMAKYGNAFFQKVFAAEEMADQDLTCLPPEKVAGRWAAKEAVAKALSCGFGSCCAITDIHILHDEKGAPSAVLSGEGKKYAEKSGIRNIFITITHEKEYAAAVAVLEK